MKNDNSKVLIALAAGATAGLAAGILLAPSNGKESRDGLLKAAGQLADSVNGQIAPYLEKLSGLTSLLGGSEGANGASKSSDNNASAASDNAGAQS
ncbi:MULTISPECIES: YtxH domain-containing protein [Rufibacter]|uniref:YtxH domain-containing protein n=1 Tax=Rufibacter TaxID=1379908 RepID=UPI001B3123CD|nr:MULTISPECIES: YtxH domain-containing protein [Rufibacter]